MAGAQFDGERWEEWLLFGMRERGGGYGQGIDDGDWNQDPKQPTTAIKAPPPPLKALLRSTGYRSPTRSPTSFHDSCERSHAPRCVKEEHEFDARRRLKIEQNMIRRFYFFTIRYSPS